MIQDARDLADGEQISVDVCVVGAGAAGITLARALRDRGLSIGLLEGGGLAHTDENKELLEGEMSGLDTWALHHMRAKIFGGSTSMWAGFCKPLAPEDFEARPWIPLSGWPLTAAELEPYYQLAAEAVQIGDPLWDAPAVAGAEGLALLLADSARIENHYFQYSPPTRFGALYRDELEDAPDVETYLWANLVEIVLTAGLDQVDRLVFRTLEGTTLSVEAGTYVLALGGIENARILLASDRQLPGGVANSSDAVGRYFMEHPHYRGSAAWVMNGSPDLSFYVPHRVTATVGQQTLDDVLIRGIFELSASIRAQEGLPSMSVQINAADPDQAALGPISPGMVEAMLAAESSGQSFVRLTLHTEQIPDPESRITLQRDERDPLGLPRADLHWRIHPSDRRTIKRGLEILGAEIGAAGAGRLWIPAEGDEISWFTGVGGHHMGTVRMSADPALGVVDGDCRCHDVGNLYVVGTSAFATGGNSNPTLTVVALAERLAAHLLERS